MWNAQLRIPWPRPRTYDVRGKQVLGSTPQTERNFPPSNGLSSLMLSFGHTSHSRWTPIKMHTDATHLESLCIPSAFHEVYWPIMLFSFDRRCQCGTHFSFRKNRNIDRQIMSNYRPSNQTIHFHFVCSNRLFCIDCGDVDDHVGEMLRAISVFTRLT